MNRDDEIIICLYFLVTAFSLFGGITAWHWLVKGLYWNFYFVVWFVFFNIFKRRGWL